MSNAPVVPSSDLEQARALSVSLTRAREAERALAAEQKPPAYARFQRTPPPPLVRAAPAPKLNFRALEGAGSSSWNEFLDWTRLVSQADVAFVADDSGLMVACRGHINGEYLENLVARLSMTFEQTGHMRQHEQSSEAVLVELDGAWLSGIRMPVAFGGRLLLGLMSARPIELALRDRVVQVLAAAFDEE